MEPLTTCPRKLVTPDIYLAVQTASDIELGLGWPNGGGWMDESQPLVAGTRIARDLTEQARAHYNVSRKR
jgi:hypothetical protein